MLRLLLDEFQAAMDELKARHKEGKVLLRERELSMATGRLAYPFIRQMAEEMMKELQGLRIYVYEIRNDFFGEMITVSGLLTGQDIQKQLRGKKLGERLLLPQNVLRSQEDVFLDDITVSDLEKTLQVKIDIVKSSGYDFVNSVIG
jgi:NifB/MoaA-like Fe-S oxidoreductase